MDYNEVWFSRSTFHEKAKKKSEGCIQKSKNIARIMSHSVTIWRNVNVASFFAPDNGTYLWSQILIYAHPNNFNSNLCNFLLKANRSSHLGIHKQMNACWSLPKEGKGFWNCRNCEKGRVSETAETVISETPQRHFININKLTKTTIFSLPVHFQGNFSCSEQLTGRTPLVWGSFLLVESQCFALSFFLNPWLGRPAGGVDFQRCTKHTRVRGNRWRIVSYLNCSSAF